MHKTPRRKRLKTTAVSLIVALSASGLWGCQMADRLKSDQPFSQSAIRKSPSVSCLTEPDYPVKEYKNDEERWEAQRKLRLEDDFRANFQRFAYDTASGILKGESGNSLYSPASLFFSLSLAASGAEGNTRKELLDLLGFETAGQAAEECRKAYTSFYQDEPNYHFQISSSLWAKDTIPLKDSFLSVGKESYFAEIYHADFSSKETGKAMGQWVKEHTGGIISPEFDTSENQLLFLLNTIYYYDEWRDRFDKNATKEGTFTCTDGSEVTCEFMNCTMGSHGYLRGENYTVSSLITKNGEVAFLLPDKGTDLQEFIKTPKALESAFQGEFKYGEVIWQVPKFSYESAYKDSLMATLRELGVKDAFSPENADFSGISDEMGWINSIRQETHVGIDENGIEAAGFTVIEWCGAALPDGRAEMILDRPFLYVIKNQGCPIFIGICQNPAE